jgi:fused signal recognition particle receptor
MLVLWIFLVLLLIATVATLAVRGRIRRRTPPPPGTRPSGAPQHGAPPPPTTGAPPLEAPPTPADEAVPSADEAAPVVEEAHPAELRDGMGKTRGLLAGYWRTLRSRSSVDDQTWDDIEEALLRADVGVATTTALLDDLRERVRGGELRGPDAVLAALREDLRDSLETSAGRDLRFDDGITNVWLFVGVNGVGKTTTIGKVARRQLADGRSVLLAAGDTFRAAAAEQLETWGERAGVPVVRGAEGGDPSAIVFDAVQRAAARGNDLVLADTAGRLHTKVNLVEELKKIRRVAGREPGNVTEVLLVLDATTGQNGLAQARIFLDAVEVTGVVLTKLDGSAKGGIVVAIQRELGIPVKLVGVGEGPDDLIPFEPAEFVDALFG